MDSNYSLLRVWKSTAHKLKVLAALLDERLTMKWLLLPIIALVVLSISMVSTSAQSETTTCAPDDYVAIADLLETAAADLRESDDPGVLLTERLYQIALAQAECSALTFDSATYGQEAVIGPVTIPAGVYRLIATAPEIFGVGFTVLSGECDDPFLGYTGGEAAEGAQSVFESEGCDVLIETEHADTWSIVFEKIQ